MAITYAQKFSPLVDEAFVKRSLTNGIVNQEYDWTGVDTVQVYSIPTVELNDYKLTGANRFGEPDELENSVQTMKLTKDRSFTFTIDKKSEQDTVGAMDAAKALAREVNQVVIPEVDKYRLSVLAAAAPAKHVITAACTRDDAYEGVLAVNGTIDEDQAPTAGRVILITPAFYNLIKLDSSFVKAGDLGTKIAQTGFVGMIDDLMAIKVPASYMPADTDFIITHPIVMPSPVKLTEYRILTDVPGLSGALVEGRIRYDAFALNQKKAAIGVHKSK